ncbi:MAG: hypothetical protein ACTSQF_00995 [Candidatus Heimdallarchaeaceae archaeon]
MAKIKLIKCKCGNTWEPLDVPTNKEWNFVSPMPDKQGNVTITRMASWSCPECGKSKTGAKGKTKGEFKEENTPKYKIEHAITSGKQFKLADLAESTGFDIDNIRKIIPMYMKKQNIKGEIKDDIFFPK